MKTLLTALTLATALTSVALAAEWQIVPQTSRLSWSTHFNHQPVSGQFTKWDGKINLDPDHPETGSITITVDVTSITSQDDERDATLKSPDFFNTQSFPQAVFTSTKISKTSQGYVAAGNLSMAGVTKPLAVPFTLTVNGKQALAQGTIHISRKAFGIGKGQWAKASQLDDLALVSFTVAATTP